MTDAGTLVTVRRHWGAFHTPWVVRKLRRSADTRQRLPQAYAFTGSSAEVEPWVRALATETEGFAHRPVSLAAATPQPTGKDRSRTEAALDGASNVDISGGDWLGGTDEFGLVIIAVIAALLVP